MIYVNRYVKCLLDFWPLLKLHHEEEDPTLQGACRHMLLVLPHSDFLSRIRCMQLHA